MKINSDLGYEPVTYSELTDDEKFWAGCKSCVNYDILMSKERKNCMCTAMLYDPKDHYEPEETQEILKKNQRCMKDLCSLKQSRLIKTILKKEKGDKTRKSNLFIVFSSIFNQMQFNNEQKSCY